MQRFLKKFFVVRYSWFVKMSNNEGKISMTDHIKQKLANHFLPMHLEVECESAKHNVPSGVEIHFRLQIVSEKFHGLSRLERQRLIHKLLAKELESSIHALRIDAKSPSEYNGESQIQAPKCSNKNGAVI